MKTIKIGHMDWTIRSMGLSEAECREAFGQCDPSNGEITIRAHMTPANQAETVLHELIHACFWSYMLPKAGMAEEDVATRLAPALAAMLRDNPWLPGELLKGLNGKPMFKEPK